MKSEENEEKEKNSNLFFDITLLKNQSIKTKLWWFFIFLNFFRVYLYDPVELVSIVVVNSARNIPRI